MEFAINVFVAGWNITMEMQNSALLSLRRMTSIYPSLDLQSLNELAGPGIFVAVMQLSNSDRGDSSLRMQIHGTATELCFYDGCLVQPSGRFNPMNAQELFYHWDEVEASEGQFWTVRAQLEGPRLEVRNDFLGMGQVYFWTEGGRWLLSNSVELLATIIRSAELDLLGISLAISFDWVAGDRTLHKAIRVLPAAAHWKWEGDINDPVKSCDYPLSRLWSHRRASRFDYSEAVELGTKLARICTELSKHQGVLKCPLTDGRDSRALALLMMRADVSATYYTDAFPGSEVDVATGQKLAQEFGLSYEVITKDIDDLICDWPLAMDQLVSQNDGMVSLWQMVDVLGGSDPERSPPTLIWGVGGEIGRANFDHPKWHYGLKSAKSAKHFLAGRLLQKSELIKDEALTLARRFLDQWIEQKLDSGCPIADIPDLFYTFERVRRWGGSNARKIHPRVNLFAPLCTRPFVEAAFRLTPSFRFSEPLHYQLIGLNPKLHRIPFSTEPWRNQNPNLAMFKMIWEKKIRRAHPDTSCISAQAIILEKKLGEVRNFCMETRNSHVWNYIRRPQFDSLLSKTTSSEARQQHLPLLLQVLTLLRYEQLLRGTVEKYVE